MPTPPVALTENCLFVMGSAGRVTLHRNPLKWGAAREFNVAEPHVLTEFLLESLTVDRPADFEQVKMTRVQLQNSK